MFIHPRSWFVFRFDKTGNGVVLNIHVYESHTHNATLWLLEIAEDNNSDNNKKIQ